MKKKMKGVCFLFSETGTEGGWWAIQEDGFVTEDGCWKYEGLQYLKEGDDFTVYAGNGSVLFHGIIHQDSRTGAIPHQVIRNGKLVSDPTRKQQVVGGFWVHWIQKGIDPDVWNELFTGYKRCLVKREDARSTRRARKAGTMKVAALVDRLRAFDPAPMSRDLARRIDCLVEGVVVDPEEPLEDESLLNGD